MHITKINLAESAKKKKVRCERLQQEDCKFEARPDPTRKKMQMYPSTIIDI